MTGEKSYWKLLIFLGHVDDKFMFFGENIFIRGILMKQKKIIQLLTHMDPFWP